MMKSKILIFSLFAIVSHAVANDFWVRKVQIRSDYMITTRTGNFAIKSPDFLQNEWLTLYANDKNYYGVTSDCKKLAYIFANGQKNVRLIDEVKTKLDSQASAEVCSIELGKGKQKSLEIIAYSEDGSTDNILSLNMRHATDEIALVGETSIFYQEGVLTTIYRDGKIEMMPAICLTQEEREYLDQLHSAEENYRKLMERSEQSIATIMDEFIENLASKRIIAL